MSKKRDPLRRIALIVVALATLIAAYALLTALLDTKPTSGGDRASEAGR